MLVKHELLNPAAGLVGCHLDEMGVRHCTYCHLPSIIFILCSSLSCFLPPCSSLLHSHTSPPFFFSSLLSHPSFTPPLLLSFSFFPFPSILIFSPSPYHPFLSNVLHPLYINLPVFSTLSPFSPFPLLSPSSPRLPSLPLSVILFTLPFSPLSPSSPPLPLLPLPHL